MRKVALPDSLTSTVISLAKKEKLIEAYEFDDILIITKNPYFNDFRKRSSYGYTAVLLCRFSFLHVFIAIVIICVTENRNVV